MGKHDPIVPLAASEQVINLFNTRGAQVEEVWVKGHEMPNLLHHKHLHQDV
ncbi:hypothetical protein IDG69_15020 [Staphylococcus sp. EG-SA-23]|nr:hypothetical protein [Staphylococcus sp. EG-SA-23]